MRSALPLIFLAGCNACAHTQHVTRSDTVEIRKTAVKIDLPTNPFPSNDPKIIGRTPRPDDFAAAPPDAGE